MSDPNNPTRERGLLYGFMDRLGMFRHPAPSSQYQPALERPSERVAVELMMGGYQAGSDKKIDGWKRLDRDELRQRGGDADRLQDASTGLDVTVYAKGDSLAANFCGTKPTSFKDWLTNFKQHIGLDSPQHDQSVEVAKYLKTVCGPNLVCLLGHSKGGGQAMLASTVTGVPAIVANSASLHENTLAKHGVDIGAIDKPALPIKTLSIEGEVLASLQSASPFKTHQDLGANRTFSQALIERGSAERIFCKHYDQGMSMDEDLTKLAYDNTGSLKFHFTSSMKQAQDMDAHLDERSGSMVQQALEGGLKQVDDIVESRDRRSLFLVQGDPNDASHKRVQIDGGLDGLNTRLLLDKLRQHDGFAQSLSATAQAPQQAPVPPAQTQKPGSP